MTRLPGDVVAFPEAQGRWRLCNVFAKTSLMVEADGLEVAHAAEEADDDGLAERYGDRTFSVWEVEAFTNEAGLLADPSRYIRDPLKLPWAEELTAPQLAARLRKHHLLIDDDEAYRARFAPKKDILDRERFGNFHQQLGQHLLLVARQNPEQWWLEQKFNEDMRSVRDNLYGAIQAKFLEQYFAQRLQPGMKVVDVGCGTGFYSNLMARSGADVLGVDPTEKFLAIAREHAEPTARFELAAVSEPGALDAIESGSADVVFMSDALLLFYFVPAAPGQVADLSVLLNDVRRILKPGGRFISLEPHYTFWLQPWLGDEDRPFTVLTEYLNKTFGVTASVSELISAYNDGGFAVAKMLELTPDPSFEAVDPRAYHFASQFPLWQLYELIPVE